MATTFNVDVDLEAFMATYLFAGTLELFDEEHPFIVSTDIEGDVIEITWPNGEPTEDKELLALIEKDIKDKV